MASVLEVTVFDEDRDHKVEFLGRVVIPLLRIHNNEKRWYALKYKKMYSRAKGNSPQVLDKIISPCKKLKTLKKRSPNRYPKYVSNFNLDPAGDECDLESPSCRLPSP